MKDGFFFVTGMFRSGTTLIARMLQSHPDLVCASDPFMPLFKLFRNTVAETSPGFSSPGDAPFDDYYFYEDKNRFFQVLQESSFDLECAGIDWDKYLESNIRFAMPFSPLIKPHMKELPGANFREVIQNALRIIEMSYGAGKKGPVGFKEVWTNDYGLQILRDFPESRVIHVVRDPRAVCASNMASESRYPLIFLARQWRKLAAASIYQANYSQYRDRVYLLRYEDLISDPEKTIPDICRFLDVDMHDNLLHPSTFVDGNNQPWMQNTSHDNPKKEFNADSLYKWRSKLKPEYMHLMEAMCAGEMTVLGYEKENKKPGISDDLIISPVDILQEDVAQWLSPYVRQDRDSQVREMALEQIRLNSLYSSEAVSKEVAQRYALWPEVYEEMKRHLA